LGQNIIFKHEDTNKSQTKANIILIFYIRDPGVHFAILF